MKKILRYTLLFVLLFGVITGIAVWVKCCSAEKRAKEYTGTPEQDRAVSEELIAVYSPEHGMAERLVVMAELHPTLSKMPREKRHAIFVNAVLTSVDRSLTGLAALSPAEKKKKIELICKDAQVSYEYYNRLSEEKKRRIREIMTKGEGRRMFEKLNLTIASSLSPADREAVGPAIRVWHEMLKGKGK